MKQTLPVLVILLLVLVMIPGVIAAADTNETYTELLDHSSMYYVSGTTSISGYSGGTHRFDFAWQLDFDTMPTGPSTMIMATDDGTNITRSQISIPFTAYYNNTLLGGGTVQVSNGSFQSKLNQIVFYWTSFTMPSYGVTGSKDIILNTTIDSAEGSGNVWMGGYSLNGVPAGGAVAMWCRVVPPSTDLYTFNYPIHIYVTYIFKRDTTTGLYRFSLLKNGFSTKATVYSPDTTKAFTETGYSITDRTDQVYVSGGTVVGQIYTALGGGIYLNTSHYFEPTYNVSITDKTITQAGTTSLTTSSSTGSYALLNAFSLDINGDSGGTCNSGGFPTAWVKNSTDGHWKQWDPATNWYTIDHGANFPTPFSIGNCTSAGTYTVNAVFLQTDGYGASATTDFTVTGEGTAETLKMYIKNARTDGLIYGATGSVKTPLGVWDNKTQTTTPPEWSVNTNSYYGYTCSATGYDVGALAYTLITGSQNVTCLLVPTTTVANGTAAYDVYVKTAGSTGWIPLNGATVKITIGNGTAYTKVTANAGVATFTLPASEAISVTATMTGYQSLTRTDVTASSAMSSAISMELSPLSHAEVTTAVPTFTPAPTSAEGKANAGLDILADVIIPLAYIASWVILIWALWQALWHISGGAVIGRMMNRGRGGRRK